MRKIEPNLKNLIDDFNQVGQLKNNRLAILNLQLYAEHYVNEIVMTQMSKHAQAEVRTYLTFPQKLRVLEEMKIVDEKKKQILQALNKVRDNLVHELTISPEEILEKLKHTKLDFKYSYTLTINGVPKTKTLDLAKEYKKIPNKFNQLTISSILIIGILYNALQKIQQKPTTQFIDLEFIKHGENLLANFKVQELQ